MLVTGQSANTVWDNSEDLQEPVNIVRLICSFLHSGSPTIFSLFNCEFSSLLLLFIFFAVEYVWQKLYITEQSRSMFKQAFLTTLLRFLVSFQLSKELPYYLWIWRQPHPLIGSTFVNNTIINLVIRHGRLKSWKTPDQKFSGQRDKCLILLEGPPGRRLSKGRRDWRFCLFFPPSAVICFAI